MPTTTLPVQNPWLNISWNNTIASIDAGILTPAYCSKNGIDITDLPGPFMGSINCSVVLLSLNPGISPCNACFIGNAHYEKLMQDTLSHNINRHVQIYDDIWCDPNKRVLYPGCEWWRKRTQALRRAISPKPLNIFALEYFPYHTAKKIKFPPLFSDEYRDYLLEQAMNDEKLIVIMRSSNDWYSIKNNGIGARLQNYANKITLNSTINVSLTPGNMNPKDWQRLLAALSSPPTPIIP